MITCLVLYYSRHGHTQSLARQIARGIEQVNGCKALLRTVPEIGERQSQSSHQDPYVTHQDLQNCAALALGSPVWFGAMATPLKHFIDSTSQEWLSGTLIDKPACVFTSGSSMHGGQESTLHAMMIPLLHHGMMIMGIPYSEPKLHSTQSGGGTLWRIRIGTPQWSITSR